MSTTSIKNIMLIGYMATGKSTIGKQLAEKMGRIFIDLDDEIALHEAMSISDIFRIKGEEYFRKLEHQQLLTTMKAEGLVVATGGGTPCFFDNIDLMLGNSKVVYLQSSPSKIVKRLLGETKHRPLVEGKTEKELKRFIEQHLKSRRPYYNKADITIRTCNPIPQIVDRIIKRL